VSIKITGLDMLQREMSEASAALAALDGEFAVVRFDPNDLVSVEAAIVQMAGSIDEKIASYRGNAVVKSIASQLKEKCREQLLERAAEARASQKGNSTGMAAIDTILSQLQNTLSDLRVAEYNTYERHIKKLSRILHAPELDGISRRLTEGIDLESWLAAGLATQGGMVGSAVLSWPPEHEKELGTVVLLIDRFAEKSDEALNFSHTFYNAGSYLTDNLQNMTRQMIVPFARDYISHVRAQAPTGASPPRQTDVKPPEVLSLRPTIYGVGIDLKEVWRRLRNRWTAAK